MKFLALATIVTAVSGSVLFERAVCNQDNCARAVIGTVNGQAQVTSRKNDCSSYQKVTSYTVKTVTSSSGSVTSTKSATPSKNTKVTPTKIPSYATQATCTGTAYESACLNCASVTRSTITSTVTATVFVPTKVTTTTTNTCAQDNCYRAVLGTAPAAGVLSTRLASCSAYQTTTIYTNSAGSSVSMGSSSVPTFASFCSPSGSFKSACSCGGITATTVKKPATTTTPTIPSNTCAQDNCYRAVLGTAPAAGVLSTRLASCSAYQTTTIYTNAAGSSVSMGSSSVPTFASFCSPSGSFKSACSCGGITATTVKKPAPTK